MIKIWSNKKALFHIPKTAGSTVTDVFNRHWGKVQVRISNPSGQHHLLQEVRDIYGIDIDDLTIYTIVRNPYQCVVSLYTYVRYGDQKARAERERDKARAKREKVNAKTLVIYDLNFSDYIDWYCEEWPSYKDWLLVDGVLPENIIVWRTETIDSDLKNFFGKQVKIPHICKSTNKHYSEYFNRKLYDKINKKYEWCFNQGFYEME